MKEREVGAEQGELEALRFEEALARLERIVDALESGELDLERSLEEFERGVALVRVCSERLRAAEVRLKALELGPDGLRERPLDPGER